MPYRRLPNTDQARLRSMKAALDMVGKVPPSELRISQKSAHELASFTPQFEQAVMQYIDSKNLQSGISKQVAEAGRLARLYLSHFIQVFNMCIARDEIRPEARVELGLDTCAGNLPDITSDQQLLEWGRKVVDGEEKRMSMSYGNRIYNPSIAVVKVKLDIFREHYNKHRDILLTSQKYHAKLEEIRVKADAIILQAWNEVETSLAPVDNDEKRALCQEYGLVYFYRPQERQKEFLNL